MDPSFDMTEELERPPGTSPFHARGIFYDHLLKHASTLPGGIPRFLSEMRDPAVREFMSQRFKWTEWYDAIPMTAAQVALCRIDAGEFETLVRARARRAAQNLVPRLFRVVLGMGNPKLAAEHLQSLLVRHYDFSDLAVEVTGNEGRGTVQRLPRRIAPSFVNVVVGLVDGALGLMGAKSIEGGYSNVREAPPAHGFPTVSCDIHFRWKK